MRFVSSCRDLTAPSPLAAEVLSARPYAFLDDAPLEERRTQAVMSRRWGDIESTADFGALDADAIAAVREEAWPQARTPDELHEALMGLGFLTEADMARNPTWSTLFDALIAQRRATRLANLRIPAERLPQFQNDFRWRLRSIRQFPLRRNSRKSNGRAKPRWPISCARA